MRGYSCEFSTRAERAASRHGHFRAPDLALGSALLSADHPTRPSPSRAVLIVEDDDDARDLLSELIDAMGYRTVQAATAAQALAQVERGGLDLALIDLGLPDQDGLEVARRIRATVAGAGMQLIALTGYSDDATRSSATAAGFDDFVVKPADPSTIERVMNARLNAAPR